MKKYCCKKNEFKNGKTKVKSIKTIFTNEGKNRLNYVQKMDKTNYKAMLIILSISEYQANRRHNY